MNDGWGGRHLVYCIFCFLDFFFLQFPKKNKRMYMSWNFALIVAVFFCIVLYCFVLIYFSFWMISFNFIFEFLVGFFILLCSLDFRCFSCAASLLPIILIFKHYSFICKKYIYKNKYMDNFICPFRIVYTFFFIFLLNYLIKYSGQKFETLSFLKVVFVI